MKKTISVKAAIKELQKTFPLINGIKPASEWNLPDAIFLGDVAEGGEIDDLPACDYYNEDFKEKIYIMGVHKKLRAKLKDLGFYPECIDPGTYLAFRS